MRRDPRAASAVPARVLLYRRVSGREQGANGTSLEEQLETGERYCAAYGWPKPIVFTEVESASEEKLERRVELAALVREARAGDVVMVAALDRWSRDVVYAVQSVRDLVRRDVARTTRKWLDEVGPVHCPTHGEMDVDGAGAPGEDEDEAA